ncbi:hypothetical protein JTE90_020476, partial [Oedothorax gibbosus]
LRLFTFGNLCGYGYGRHENYTIPPRIFKAKKGRPGDTARARVFYENSVPISGRPIPGKNFFTKKENPLPRSSHVSSSLGFYRTLVPKGPIPFPGWGILTPFPLVGTRQTRQCLRLADALASEGISRPLRPTDPCSTAVHRNPSPLQSSRFSLYFYSTKTAPGAAPGGLTPALSTTPPRTLLLTAA